MVCRIVLYRMKAGASLDEENRLVGEARKQLPGVPGVISFKAGRIDPVAQGYAVALVLEFADQAAFEAYFVHPDHQRFIKQVAEPLTSEVARFKFEA